jgi:hypothetical protein
LDLVAVVVLALEVLEVELEVIVFTEVLLLTVVLEAELIAEIQVKAWV